MSVLRALGRTALLVLLVLRRLLRGGVRTGRFVGRNVLVARDRGGAGETGMIRLLDLHAASCAGDTLVAIGLAGTVFFNVPVGEARGRVALYLLITMLPFALLAPVVGPVLDRFRHGRRYALALTMLGRAFLAYMIAEHIGGYTLYPAAFGMLVLSRAYGVARSAAVPRLLPPGLGLSESGARASVFGTVAGAVAAPFGVAAVALGGAAWPLRLSMVAFVFGMVVALRLPPRADSQPPEVVPRLLQLPGHKGAKVLSGRLVLATLAGSATLRLGYGFLTLFLAFAIRLHDLPTVVLGQRLPTTTAIGLVAASLGVGSFLATAVGTTLRIHRPTLLQAAGILAVTVAALAAVAVYSLLVVALLCLVLAVASGLAKLAVDAVIQERVPERVRASAFAHSETLLMFAWVAGGALGLIPFDGRIGLAVLTIVLALGLVRAVYASSRLRKERLRGSPDEEPDETPTQPQPADRQDPITVDLAARRAATFPRRSTGDTTARRPAGDTTVRRTAGDPTARRPIGETTARRPGAGAAAAAGKARPTDTAGTSGRAGRAEPTTPGRTAALPDQPGASRRPRWLRRRREDRPANAPATAPPAASPPAAPAPRPADGPILTEPDTPAGYHLYRPSGTDPTLDLDDEDT